MSRSNEVPGPGGRTRRHLRMGALTGVLAILLGLLGVSVATAQVITTQIATTATAVPDPASGVAVAVDNDVTAPVVVGQPAQARITISNFSFGALADAPITVGNITLNQSCGNPDELTNPAASTAPCANPENLVAPQVATQAVGNVGTACAGQLFTFGGPTADGTYTLTPATPVVLGPAATGGPLSTCVISYTTVVVQRGDGATFGTAAAVGTAAIIPTRATDLATFTVSPQQPNPTGNLTYTLVGPNPAAGCVGPIVGSSTVPAGQPSAPFVVSAPGTYNFVVSYTGDANYSAVTATGCGEPAEQFTVAAPFPSGSGIGSGAIAIAADTPTLVTEASPPVALGGTISDTATLAGGTAPTGTITFRVFGPDDATCANAPAFTYPAVTVNGNGAYAPAAGFVPTAAGTYRFIAAYSGDANNNAVSGACNDPNESVVVSPVPSLSVVKTATPATLPAPGGQFTFGVTATNNGTEALTIAAINDSVFGNLATRGTCTTAVGTVIAAGANYQCAFPGVFTGGPGASETNVVTVSATTPTGVPVNGLGAVTVRLTANYACMAATAITMNGATLQGVTDDPAVVSATFTVREDGVVVGSPITVTGTSPFTTPVTGLTPSTAYTYTVVFNPGANAQTNAACAFTTQADPNASTTTSSSSTTSSTSSTSTSTTLGTSTTSSTVATTTSTTAKVYKYECGPTTINEAERKVVLGQSTDDPSINSATFIIKKGDAVVDSFTVTRTSGGEEGAFVLDPGTTYTYTVTFNPGNHVSNVCTFTVPGNADVTTTTAPGGGTGSTTATTAPSAAASAATANPLPRTGADPFPLARVALALVAAGLVLLALGHRWRGARTSG